jgi:hypothetical protein
MWRGDRAEWVLMDFFTFIVHVFASDAQVLLSSGSGGTPSVSKCPTSPLRAPCGRDPARAA